MGNTSRSEHGLRRCHDLDAFLADPGGAYVHGDTFAYFYINDRFTGFSLFGVPTASDIEHLNRAMDVVLGPHGAPHLSLIDTSALRAVDPAAFLRMTGYLARRFEDFKHVILRQAMVRPGGLVGSIVAGFYSVLDPPYPVAVFAERTQARASLGCAEAERADALLAEVHASAGDTALLSALHHLLAQDPTLALDDCAHRLAISRRTLQRKLGECGTTFGRELRGVQIARAKALMHEGQLSLTAIAYEVGFCTPQQFSAQFKSTCGVSPSDWLRALARNNDSLALGELSSRSH